MVILFVASNGTAAAAAASAAAAGTPQLGWRLQWAVCFHLTAGQLPLTSVAVHLGLARIQEIIGSTKNFLSGSCVSPFIVTFTDLYSVVGTQHGPEYLGLRVYVSCYTHRLHVSRVDFLVFKDHGVCFSPEQQDNTLSIVDHKGAISQSQQ